MPLNNFNGVSFTSENTNILTVTAVGLVKGVGFGTANIMASYGGQSVAYAVTVAPLPQAGVLA